MGVGSRASAATTLIATFIAAFVVNSNSYMKPLLLHWSTKKCPSLKISYFLNFGALIPNPTVFFDECTRFRSVAGFAVFLVEN